MMFLGVNPRSPACLAWMAASFTNLRNNVNICTPIANSSRAAYTYAFMNSE